jgi:hypothetical protein
MGLILIVGRGKGPFKRKCMCQLSYVCDDVWMGPCIDSSRPDAKV